MATHLEYGEHKVEIAAIPEAVAHAFLQRTFAHKMGNEVAANVTAKIVGKDGLANSDATRDQIKAWRESHAEQVSAWENELRTKLVADILSGEVGTRSTGPRLDPVEKKFQQLLVNHIKALLPKGMKFPKDDETVLTFSNGETRTRSQMLTNAEATFGEKLRKDAERLVKEEQRMAARAAAEAEKSEQTASALGI